MAACLLLTLLPRSALPLCLKLSLPVRLLGSVLLDVIVQDVLWRRLGIPDQPIDFDFSVSKN